MNNKIIIRAIIVFVVAIIPPSLGLFSFFRYEDFYHMAYMKIHLPDFSWDSLLNIPTHRLYEYYRPVLTFFYWLGYLLSHNNPIILHALASLSFGGIAVLIYFIARFFSGELAGLLAAVAFATFGPSISVSWWTGTFAVLPGFILFLFGILSFIYLDRHYKRYTVLSLFLFACSFFNKESFIILSPLLLLFCLSTPKFRSRYHFMVALGVIPCALAKVYIANIIMGATVNSHVHFNILEIDPTIIWTNLYSYWQLLVYGHNYWFVLLSLLSVGPMIFQDKQKVWTFLPTICAVVFILRIFNQIWAIDLILIVLTFTYLWYCSYYERIWVAWIALGLSQLVFWDIPIIGGLMNRLILEPSVGFALLLGSGLARQIQAIRDLNLSKINPLHLFRMQRTRALKYVFSTSISAGAFLGIAEEVTYLGGRQLMRDFDMWYSQGAVLEDIIGYVVNDMPTDTALIMSEPPLAGMQVTDQMGDALVLFDRSDISVSYTDLNSLKQSIQRVDMKHPVFLISTNPLDQQNMEEGHTALFRLSFQSVHDEFTGYIYELYP